MPLKLQTRRGFWREPAFARGVFVGTVLTSTSVMAVLKLKERKKEKKEELKEMLKQSPLEDVHKLERGREILKYGIPDIGNNIRYYSNHVLVYNQQHRTPVWVAEHLTKDWLKGNVHRNNITFKSDPGVAATFTAHNSDYYQSGWTRGHMAPAGDNKRSQTAMEETFYLSNIVPQNYENNAGFWNRLELYCRDLAAKYSSVYVLSGPLVLPVTEDGGKKVVKYQVIGENNVAVPTHLFKVIIVEDRHSQPSAIGAFVVPNEPIGFEHHLKEYQVSLPYLERISGIRLVPNIDMLKSNLNDLCVVEGCNLIDRVKFELYFIGRKLESATTLHRVEKVWAELEEKKLKPDKYLQDLYNNKKKELDAKEGSKS